MTTATTAAQSALVFDIFGYQLNFGLIVIVLALLGILLLFYRIQKSQKLDFADMITKDGRSVSLTKILQLLGGVTATWVIIKLTMTAGMTEGLLGVYLAYVGAVEGYSKYVSAKYGYSEKSVKDAKALAAPESTDDDPSLKPPKV